MALLAVLIFTLGLPLVIGTCKTLWEIYEPGAKKRRRDRLTKYYKKQGWRLPDDLSELDNLPEDPYNF